MLPKKILILEDEGSIRKLCQRLLANWGYELTMVARVDEAFKSIDEKEFDLLITDLKLPDGNGSSVVQKFKMRFPNSKAIIMTGSITPNEDTLKELGDTVLPYLLKPFQIEEFMQVVQSALEMTVQ
jgi:DNA-binding NtrC family response regulator